MPDVGLGQLITTTGRYRSKKLKDAVRDNMPVYEAMDKNGGISRAPGGRTVVQEAKSGQNSTVDWVGESGSVPLTDIKVLDASEFNWFYQLGAVTFTKAEQLRNSGGGDLRFIDVIGGKFEVLEDSCMNEFHAAMLSNGTGSGGLQMAGLAALVSTTPSTGTVGGINRATANAAWFRNLAFNTATDWTDGIVDASNVKRFFDKGLNATTRQSKSGVQLGIVGQTHFEFLTQAIQAIQVINDKTSDGEAGFQRLIYRGVPMYFGNGLNYSGQTAMTLTRSYLLNVKPGGVNLVFHKDAEFDLLEEVSSADQAAISRLMFTMATMTIGGLAAQNWVGFD